MKVILTNTFKKKYLKSFSKYFTQNDFIKFLKDKNHIFVGLHYPYFKIKGYVKMVSIRGILFLLDKNDIIPLMVFLKKDKKYGENVNWNEYKDFIGKEYDKALIDIENGEFEEF